MREIDPQTAVDEIVASTKRRRDQSPFFLTVGAGISHPQMPLSAGIEELCRKKLAERGQDLARLALDGKPSLERYATLLEAAYPQPMDRQEFLHDLIHRAPISTANFRLAHLLGECQLTNLVFTSNFDEMLSRACRLLGYDVIVCDHPKTTGRIRPSAVLPQIVHVHGTHWFYDCCNLKAEIDVPQSDPLDGLSMGQLLDRVLADRSPIVVGYSGWEGDIMMAAFRRRLLHAMLPYNLYWFCFRLSDIDALPSWLKEHKNVRLVLPPPTSSGEATLAARVVFEAFIRHLDLAAPLITVDPLKSLQSKISRDLNELIEGWEDVYILNQLPDYLDDVSKSVKDYLPLRARDPLYEIGSSLRSLDYHSAIEEAIKVSITEIPEFKGVKFYALLEELYKRTQFSHPHLALRACDIRIDLSREFSQGQGYGTSEWLLKYRRAEENKIETLRFITKVADEQKENSRPEINPKVATVFICYSHKDEKWKNSLVEHLGIFESDTPLRIWSDKNIQAGEFWFEEILNAMNSAQIAVVFISASSLSSEFMRTHEFPRLLERREKEGMAIIPVIARDCAWGQISWLSRLEVRPRSGKPLAKYPLNNRESQLAIIAKEVLAIMKKGC